MQQFNKKYMYIKYKKYIFQKFFDIIFSISRVYST